MFLAAAASLALVATACGGGGGSGATTTPTGATTTTGEATPSAGTTATGGGTQGGEVTVEAVDNAFQPDTLTATADQRVAVENTGSALHNFSIKENGTDFDIQPGESENESAFEGLAPGTYTFFCKYHQSIGMEGMVTVSG